MDVREVTVHKTGGGQLFVYIPKAIERHFGIREGQKVYADWDESDPENPKIVYHLTNPRSVVGVRKERREAEVQQR